MAADWFNLGLQLDMDDAQLWVISGERRRAVEWFKMTLSEWRRSGNVTHKVVIKALDVSWVGTICTSRKTVFKRFVLCDSMCMVYLASVDSNDLASFPDHSTASVDMGLDQGFF